MDNQPPKSKAVKEMLSLAAIADSYRDNLREVTYELETSFLQGAYRIRDRAQAYRDGTTPPGGDDTVKEYEINPSDRISSSALSEPDPSIFTEIYNKIGVNQNGSGSAFEDLKKIMANIHLFPGMENFNLSSAQEVRSLSPQVTEDNVFDDVTQPSRNEIIALEDVDILTGSMDGHQDDEHIGKFSDDYFIEFLPSLEESDDDMNKDVSQPPRKKRKVAFMEEVIVRLHYPNEPERSEYDQAFQSSQSSNADYDLEPPRRIPESFLKFEKPMIRTKVKRLVACTHIQICASSSLLLKRNYFRHKLFSNFIASFC